jgi:hypothetical protein
MARYGGIRVDRLDEIISNFTVDPEHVTQVFTAGVLVAAEQAARVMEKRVKTATTKTGVERAARGGQPGRIRTGALIHSIRKNGQPAIITGQNTRAGRVQFKIGFITPVLNKSGDNYAVYQNFGRYSISGQLLAAQFGYNKFVSVVFNEAAKAARQIGDELNGRRYSRRAASAASKNPATTARAQGL